MQFLLFWLFGSMLSGFVTYEISFPLLTSLLALSGQSLALSLLGVALIGELLLLTAFIAWGYDSSPAGTIVLGILLVSIGGFALGFALPYCTWLLPALALMP